MPLYEAALDQLRADDTPPEPEQLVRCAERIELLRDRQANDGRFERPIPLGHKAGACCLSFVDGVLCFYFDFV